MKSFINHSVDSNLSINHILPNLIFVYALNDIQKGEELLVDYCIGVDRDNLEDRNAILAKYDITLSNPKSHKIIKFGSEDKPEIKTDK